MKPMKHKKLILKLVTQLREAVCHAMEDGHVLYPPKRMPDVEADISDMVRELERTQFLKGN